MDPSWVLSLPEGLVVENGAAGELILSGPYGRLTLRELGSGLLTALRCLTAPGEAAGRLAETVVAMEGSRALARWYFSLQHLARLRLLLLTARTGGDRLATLVGAPPALVLAPAPSLTGRPCVLSRFAYLHRGEEGLVLESPLGAARVVLHDARAAALVHALAVGQVGNCLLEGPKHLLTLLISAGMAHEAGDAPEDADASLRCWEFHDLLFHARSRPGRHGAPVGATYRFVGQSEPPPALKPGATEGIALHRPDLEELCRSDPPFARVQEARRSLRQYAAEPITDRQLGEFLYRVARVREYRAMEVETPQGTPLRMPFAARPYPSGGALYELEVYAVVNACGGLTPGLYHYDGRQHRLETLTGRTPAVAALLADAEAACGAETDSLQVLLILATRFPRLAWKYASVAYALTLKHVGVVYQTMYLAATAMGLAPCALGAGDSDLFARAAGADYYAETSVGEFLLGSKPPAPPSSPSNCPSQK